MSLPVAPRRSKEPTSEIPVGSSPIWRVTIKAMSDQTRIFRAVPITAP